MLESEISFLQVKTTMSIQAKIRQVKMEICSNRREIAHTRLESVAGSDNPYSLLQVFGKGITISCAGATMYVTRCTAVDMLPRSALNCTDEIPITWNNQSLFVAPVSLVIKTAGVAAHCNDIAPPRWQIAGVWYCSFPELRECAPPREIPVEPVLINEGSVIGLGLGRSIYSQEQVNNFLAFQDSQGTRKAYLAETAEIAYWARGEDGAWGLGFNDLATETVISLVGMSLIPLYRFIGPAAITIIFILFLVGLIRLVLTVVIRAITIVRLRGPGIWLIGALWGTLFQIALSPLRWADHAAQVIAERVTKDMEADAAKEEEAQPLQVEQDDAHPYVNVKGMIANMSPLPWRKSRKDDLTEI
jgi:hypothetical protein